MFIRSSNLGESGDTTRILHPRNFRLAYTYGQGVEFNPIKQLQHVPVMRAGLDGVGLG